jgi:hypothetical protein
MLSIVINASGFSRLLSTRFYTSIILSQLEYSLAINSLSVSQLEIFENAQNQCLQKIYDGHARSSTRAMLHLAKLLLLKDYLHILQAQFLLNDTFLYELLPSIKRNRNHQ